VENGSTFAQVYNAENRLATVKKISEGDCDTIVKVETQWDFAYDGDGNRVKQVTSTYDPDTQEITDVSVTAYFMGGLYEVTDGSVRKYYAMAGMTVAMNDGSGLASTARAVEVAEARLRLARLKYLLTDHLGSVVAVTNASGGLLSEAPKVLL
jgi:hypothetical protein